MPSGDHPLLDRNQSASDLTVDRRQGRLPPIAAMLKQHTARSCYGEITSEMAAPGSLFFARRLGPVSACPHAEITSCL